VNDRVIVYCTSKDLGSCNSGIYVIPSYERHMVEGKYSEYVETAKSNSKWIIAKTIQVEYQNERYWIMDKNYRIDFSNFDRISCDSQLQTYVKGPFDINEFNEKKRELDIGLKF
jgi:hypothetical protein